MHRSVPPLIAVLLALMLAPTAAAQIPVPPRDRRLAPAGDYYVVAVSDIESDALGDDARLSLNLRLLK